MHPPKLLDRHLKSLGRRLSALNSNLATVEIPINDEESLPRSPGPSNRLSRLLHLPRLTNAAPSCTTTVPFPDPCPELTVAENVRQSSRQHHHAIKSPDIVMSILEHFDIEQDRAACFNMALVCRSFAEPASNVLWRRIHGLLPLWKVLGSLDGLPEPAHPVRSYVQREEFAQSLLHARSYTDMAVASRLLRRSSRVRFLEYDFMTAAECELAIDVIRTMRGPIAVLLPSLQALQLFPDYVGDVYCMLASNTLLALEILASKTPPSTFDQERLHTALRVLQERSPGLRKVTFRKTRELHVSFDQKKLVETLSGFSRLKEISTDYHLPPQALRSMGAIRSLSALNLDIMNWYDPNPGTLIRLPVFRLKLSTCVAQNQSSPLSGLCGVLQAPRLRDLEISLLEQYSDIAAFPSFHRLSLQSLGSTAFSKSLRSFTVHFGLQSRWDRNRETRFSTFLMPCFSMSQLEHICIDFAQNIRPMLSASDSDFEAIAQAWPHARRLSLLGTGYYKELEPLPSLATLAHFARNCSSLVELAIEGIEVRLQYAERPPSPMDSSCRILRLHSTSSFLPVYETERIAPFLDALFPRLDITMSRITEATPLPGITTVHPVSWTEVSEELWKLQRRRRAQGLKTH